MKHKSQKKEVLMVLLFAFTAAGLLLSGCRGKTSSEIPAEGENGSGKTAFNVAVFVPGVTEGSPLYEQMVKGVEKAAEKKENITVKVLEAGFNQGEWEEKLTALAAEKKYDLIVSENGAMPYIALPVAKAFPDQKFLFVDSIIRPNKQMYTLLYNQMEEAYLVGYLGGLITKSSMKGVNRDLKIGIIAGQEFPAMTQMIVPGYRMGASAVDRGIEVDFRVLGNWYDANKAGELAKSMIDSGVDVILPICGGANQGVIAAAREAGIYVLYFDSEAYNMAPGIIAGCVVLEQEKAVEKLVLEAYNGTLEWGTAQIVGAEEGYVRFADDSELYRSTVPADIREKMAGVVDSMKKGSLKLKIPEYWKN